MCRKKYNYGYFIYIIITIKKITIIYRNRKIVNGLILYYYKDIRYINLYYFIKNNICCILHLI